MSKINIRDHCVQVENAAQDFATRGWKTVVVPFGAKETKAKAWQNTDPKPEVFLKGPFNIGVQLGPKSGGLIDIDLDCPEAIQLADAFFPELVDAAFGRSKPDGTHVLGHRFVICDDIPAADAKVSKYDFRTPEAQAATKAIGLPKTVVLELRAGGGYTGVPPSWYPSADKGKEAVSADEQLKWRHGHDGTWVPAIPKMPYAEVKRRCGLLAFASLVLAVYPREAGGRDDFCLQLAGALIHSGMEPDQAEKFINRLARLAQDDTDKRGEKAHRTKEKADAGEPTTNLSTFLAHVALEPCEKEIRKWLGMPAKTGDKTKRHRPVVEVQESWIKLDGDCKVRRLVQMAELLLANDNEGGVYGRGRDLVRVTSDNSLLLVTPHWLAHRLQELGGTFYRTDQYGNDYRTDCNQESVLPLIDTADQRPFRRVTGLVFMPTLTRNEPGWDPETGLLLLFKDTCQVPLAPTRQAAVASLDALLDLIAYFPFTRLDSEPEQHPLPRPAERHDTRLKRANRSVALSGLLSCAIRGDLDDCPIHVSDAPAWGSGKTILLHMWHAIAEDGVFRTATWTGREEENAKNLFTLYGQGRPYIGFDDVEDRIRGKQLARAVTSPMLESRVLGHNDKSRTVSTRAFVAFSGTNVEVSEDLVRRTVVTRFDHGVEDPDSLKFPFHPLKRLQADRQTYREHCLTILRAFKAAGMPGYADLKCDGSFPSWRMVRGALVWLGQADPWDVVEVTRKTDANLYRKAQVFIAMWQGPGTDNPVSVTAFKRNYGVDGDVTLRLSPVRRLEQLLNDKTWNDTAVGMLLGKYRDQVFCGLKLSRQSDNRWVLRGTPEDGFQTLMEIE